MPSDHLRTRVARRLFMLFLLAALLPLLLMAFFSYSEVSNQLVEQNRQWLRQESKTLGMSLVKRLRWRAVELEHTAKSINSGQGVFPESEYFSGFRQITDPTGLGLNQAQRLQLARNETVLLSGKGNQLSMLIRIPGTTTVLQGDLLSEGLWYDQDMDIPYCVLGGAGRVYFCSTRISALGSGLSERITDHTGDLTWDQGNTSYLVAYWRAPLQGLYANRGFSVVMAIPREEALKGLDRFRQIFPALMVLAFVVAVWLTLKQLRNQMKPLTELAEGADRLAEGDFDTVVNVRDSGEFGMLARAFNLMAKRLKEKFHMLGALGEMDRVILSSPGMEDVIQSVLRHAPLALSCDVIGILQLDEKSGMKGRLTLRAAGKPGDTVNLEVGIDKSACEFISTDRPWIDVEQGGAGTDCLQPLFEQGIAQVLAFPVKTDARLSAVFILGLKERSDEIDELVQAGRSFADRLAIAGSNIAWEEKLYHQAHYDALTDLPNRVLLRDRVEQAVHHAKRHNKAVALMLIDLDRFKEVNDSLGHSAGDKLLIECASTLTGQVRESDTVARLGGDEFIVLVTDLDRGKECEVAGDLAGQLQKSLARPVSIHGEIIKIEASIGIALFPDNGDTYEMLLKGADAAMYESKQTLNASYRFYTEDLNNRLQDRFHLSQELHTAIDNEEFMLYFQPKVEAQTGRIAGAEVLLRWNSPRRGLVPPGQFIPVLDDIGLGSRLGEWVMNRACEQLARWDKMGLEPIKLSVNISPMQFHQTDIVSVASSTLARHGLDHRRLELEILEATAVEDSDETRGKLRRLRELGFDIALDDFGTGYSSLVYLTRLPANVLKLDLEFIRTMSADPRQASIVAGIIALAKTLGMQVVAEGIEDEGQWEMLRGMGCDLLQGYLFSRPVTPEEFVRLLETKSFYSARHGLDQEEGFRARINAAGSF